VESRSRSPAHQGDYVRAVLAGLRVRQFVTPQQEVPVLHPDDRLPDVVARLSSTAYHALPVENRVIGVVKRADISSTYLRHVHGASARDGTDSFA
jgi:CBS domain-containing protein